MCELKVIHVCVFMTQIAVRIEGVHKNWMIDVKSKATSARISYN